MMCANDRTYGTVPLDLQDCCTRADDPSVLSKKIRHICSFLGTAEHEKADQCLGRLVASHASRMLPTIWTVLLQTLSETSVARPRIVIMHYFASISERINPSQRTAAFSIFFEEIFVMFSDENVLVDRTFQDSFAKSMESLGMHAVHEVCTEIFDRLRHILVVSKSNEVLRSASLCLTHMLLNTSICGNFTIFVQWASSTLGLHPFAVVLDTCCTYVIQSAKLSTNVTAARTDVETIMEKLEDTLKQAFEDFVGCSKSVPALLSCLSKLKGYDSSWIPAVEDDLCFKALLLLEADTTKLMVIAPLLSFLCMVNVNWVASANSVWSWSECSDPFIRSEAFSALAVVFSRDDCELCPSLPLRVFQLLKKYMQLGCSFTLCGLLKLWHTCYVRAGASVGTLYRQVFQLFLPRAININQNTSVQTAVLDVIILTSIVYPETIEYCYFCTESASKSVRVKAYGVLNMWCTSMCYDFVTLMGNELSARVAFLEGSVPVDFLKVRERQSFSVVFGNYGALFSLLLKKLYAGTATHERDHFLALESVCDCIHQVGRGFKDCFPNGVRCALDSTFYSIFVVLSEFLQSLEVYPASLYLCLIRAIALCVELIECSRCFDLFQHLRLFQWVWNVIYRCCATMDPLSSPQLEYEGWHYLAYRGLPPCIEGMVCRLADGALYRMTSLASSEFHELVNCSVNLLRVLIEFGSCSEYFLLHIRQGYHDVLRCLDILSFTNVVLPLQVITSLMKVLFFDPGGCTDVSTPAKTSLMQDAPVFISLTSAIISRCLLCITGVAGEGLFTFVELLVKMDAVMGATVCYSSLDTDFALLHRMVNILCDPSSYASMHALQVAAPCMRVFCLLYSSPHRDRVLHLVTAEDVHRISDTLNSLHNHLHADLFAECKLCLLEVDMLYRKDTENVVETYFELLSARPTVDSVIFFGVFERLTALYGANRDAMFRVLGTVSSLMANVPSLVCAAAFDNSFIPLAVKAALSGPCEPFLMEFLVLVLCEVGEESELHPLELFIALEHFGQCDDAVLQLLRSYRWGWVCGEHFSEMVKNIDELQLEGDLATWIRSKSALAICSGGGAVAKEHVEDTMDCIRPCIPETQVVALNVTRMLCASACRFSEWPQWLLQDIVLNPIILTDILVCAASTLDIVSDLLSYIIGRDSVEHVTAGGTIELVRTLVSQVEVFPCRLTAEDATVLLQHLCTLFDKYASDRNQLLMVKYSCMYLALWILPCYHVSAEEMLSVGKEGSQFATARNALWILVNTCLGTQWTSLHELGKYLVELALHSSELSCDLEESIHWLLMRCCRTSIWRVISEEEVASLLDVNVILFLCRLNQTIAFPPATVLEIHARYTPLLISYGTPGEMSEDELQAVLSLTTSLFLQVVVFEGLASDATITSEHLPLADFVTGSLRPSSDAGSSLMLDQRDNFLFPLFMRQTPLSLERQWNAHRRARLLPVGCEDFSGNASHEHLCGVVTALTRMYLHVVGHTFTHLDAVAPSSLSAIFSSLSILSTSIALLPKFPNKLDVSTTTYLADHVKEWLVRYGPSTLDVACTEERVLRSHTGLLPLPMEKMSHFDTLNVAAAVSIVCCLPVTGASAVSADQLEAATLIDVLLSLDLFLHVSALSSLTLWARTASKGKMALLLPWLGQRFNAGLQWGSWGCLAFFFGVRQRLRCVCCLLKAEPDERMLMSAAAGVWSEVVTPRYSRTVQLYGHHILQCLTHIFGTMNNRKYLDMLHTLLTSDDECFRNADVSTPAWLRDPFRFQSGREPRDSTGEEGVNHGCALHQYPVRDWPLQYSQSECVLECASKFVLATHYLLTLSSRAILLQHRTQNGFLFASKFLKSEWLLSSTTPGFAYTARSCADELVVGMPFVDDAMFLTFNRFDFSRSSRQLVLRELQRLVGNVLITSDTDNAKDKRFVTLIRWLGILAQYAVLRITTEEESWWTGSVLLCATLAFLHSRPTQGIWDALTHPLLACQGRVLAEALIRVLGACSPGRTCALQLLGVVEPFTHTSPGRTWAVPMVERLRIALGERQASP